MSLFLTLAYLFFMGSVSGWVLELLFRRFISSANPERKWINPGFCTGPYLPLYGSGLCAMYLICRAGDALNVQTYGEKILLIILMGLCMTLIEYLTGLVCLKKGHVRLWDYSDEWGNIQGVICPKYTAIWTAFSALFYFLVYEKIKVLVLWMEGNPAIIFVTGLFFGVFIIDVCYNAQIVVKIKRYADEKQIIIRYENLKAQIKSNHNQLKEKTYFLFPFKTAHPLAEHLKESQEAWDERMKKLHIAKKGENNERY